MHRMQLAWRKAISKCVEGLEAQERSGFDDIHRLLKCLPVPVTKAIRVMTHAQAIEAQFLPNMTEEEQKRFTPSELLLYKHALEYKWTAEQLKKLIALVRSPDFDSILRRLTVYVPSIYWYIRCLSLKYTLIYPLFASHCLNSDLSNSDSIKPRK